MSLCCLQILFKLIRYKIEKIERITYLIARAHTHTGVGCEGVMKRVSTIRMLYKYRKLLSESTHTQAHINIINARDKHNSCKDFYGF